VPVQENKQIDKQINKQMWSLLYFHCTYARKQTNEQANE
jgi:hypothetical protein